MNSYKHIFIFIKQCQRICLFAAIVTECGCIHPLYTDFDDLRHMTIGTNDTSKMEVCDLKQGSKYYDCNYYTEYYLPENEIEYKK